MVYKTFSDLIKFKGLNGSVELRGVKLTKWQLDGLKDFIMTGSYKFCYNNVDDYGLTIVETMSESDLQFDY